MSVLNGRTEEDSDGEFTFVGARGSTVIDYIFVNDRIIDDVTAFRIEKMMDSDHLSLAPELVLEVAEKEGRGRKRLTMKNI